MVARYSPALAKCSFKLGQDGDDVQGGVPAEVAEPLEPLMYGGVWILEPRVFEYMSPGVFSITRQTGPALMRAGEALYGYRYGGYWRVLDTPDGLKAGRRDLQAKRLRFTGENEPNEKRR